MMKLQHPPISPSFLFMQLISLKCPLYPSYHRLYPLDSLLCLLIGPITARIPSLLQPMFLILLFLFFPTMLYVSPILLHIFYPPDNPSNTSIEISDSTLSTTIVLTQIFFFFHFLYAKMKAPSISTSLEYNSNLSLSINDLIFN